MCLILVGTWGRVGNVAYWDLTCGKQREATVKGVTVTERLVCCSRAKVHADSGFSSYRTSLSPFTKDFRGEEQT